MGGLVSVEESVAEGVGFEPTEGTRPSTAFKAAAFVHSATPPNQVSLRMLSLPLFGNPFQPVHIGSKGFRNDHRSIGLLIIF